MSLEQKDLEQIERIILRSTGDIAEALGCNVERFEERIDAAEARLSSRIAELSDTVDAYEEGLGDEFGPLRSDLREQLATEAPVEKF